LAGGAHTAPPDPQLVLRGATFKRQERGRREGKEGEEKGRKERGRERRGRPLLYLL